MKSNAMLVDFSVQNYRSFNEKQELSMLASTSTREPVDPKDVKEINKFGIKNILKTAAIFGANGSGKTNIINALGFFKHIVLFSLRDIDKIHAPEPFSFKEELFDIPTEFEISFLKEGHLYRYGLAISNDLLVEEWLFVTKDKKEISLFERDGQKVKFSKDHLPEASLLTKKVGNDLYVDKTKEHIPFISVLSQFNGEVSNLVISWFRDLKVISGLDDFGFKKFTLGLLDDEKFKEWALKILHSLQINGLEVEWDIDENANKISELRNIKKPKKVDVIKINNETNKKYAIPLEKESEGTKKLIYLLGPLYDVVSKNRILVVDEFDNRLHTLLSKFIIELYKENNTGFSQLIMTCHDTNLLTKELFRRDQLWFVEKNDRHESALYSLVEYAEHYTRRNASYSKDYLAGKYGAIYLFPSTEEFKGMLLNV